MAVDVKQAKEQAEAKKNAARQRIESAKREAENRKKVNKNPPPVMVEMPDATGNLEEDSAADLTALQQGFRNRAMQEGARFELAVDTEYWACLCFQTREQKEAFLAALNILEFGNKYIDGQLVADRLGVSLPSANVPYNTSVKVDKKLAELVKE